MAENIPRQKAQARGATGLSLAQKTIPPQSLGIKVRIQPENEDDIDIDILAVPGIGTDPETTWTFTERDPQDRSKVTKEVHWLSDPTMLPMFFPTARIMTFGYDTIFGGSQRLSGIAGKVLNELRRNRKDCQSRPILLIGHCFGGLVTQQVYLQSHRFPSDYPGIYDSITGMVFLGTPHHGSGFRNLVGKVYEETVQQNLQFEDSLLKTIARDDTVLVDTVADFTREVKQRMAGPEIFCFFEERPTPIGRIACLKDRHLKFVVDESSGSLPGYAKMGLTTDHFNINKFGSNKDTNYRCVAEELMKMGKKSGELMKQRRAAIRDVGNTFGNRNQQTDSDHHKLVQIALNHVAKGFVPRDGVLEKIKSHFDHSSKVVLVGACGSGKTHVAVEYSHSFRKENPEAMIYYVNAGNAAEIELSYHCINEKLQLTTWKNGNVVRIVRNYLGRVESGQWLMIIDGLDHDESVGETDKRADTALGNHSESLESIRDYIPDGHTYGGQVLVTTKSKHVATRLVNRKHIAEIPKSLSKDDALKLLLGGSKSKTYTAMTYQLKIVDALQGLAGALALVRAYKETSGPEFSWKGLWYLVQTSTYDSAVLSTQVNEQFRSILGIWKPLHAHLKANHDAAALLLHTLCRLDVQSIPVFLIYSHYDDKSQWEKHKKVLRNYDMLTLSVDLKDARVTPIIRFLANSMVSDQSNQAILLDEAALELVNDAFPSPQVEDNIHCMVLKPCALAALRLRLESAAARLTKAQLLSKLVAYERRVGTEDSVLNLLQCFELCTRDTEAVGDMEDDVKRHKQIFNWCQANYGSQHQDTMRQRFNLALALDANGHDAEAERLYLESIETMESVHGRDSPNTDLLRMRGCLARKYCEQGRFQEAEAALKRLLEGQTEILGSDHPEALTTRMNLALVASELRPGDLETPAAELQRILAAQNNLLGATHPATLRTACNLAQNYHIRGRVMDAAHLFKLAMEGQIKSLGEKHPDTMRTLAMLKELENGTETHLSSEEQTTSFGETHSDTITNEHPQVHTTGSSCVMSDGIALPYRRYRGRR